LTQTCFQHPSVNAVGICDRCHRPFCGECRTDSVQDRQYCSRICRDATGLSPGESTATVEELLRGRDRPFQTGWGLWLRASAAIVGYTAPVTLGMALLENLRRDAAEDAFGRVLALPPLAIAAWLVLGTFGAALTAVVLSRLHRRAGGESVYLHTLQRYLSWSAAWLLATLASVVGTILLIVPGVIAGIRFFWADEFALTHGDSPVAALRRSWEFTRGRFGRVFGFQWLAGLASYVTLLVILLVNTLFNAGVAASGVPGGPFVDVFVSTVGYALVFVTYGGLHANELVYFYGLRAADESEEPQERVS
jgi:hypothetical protein